MSADETLVSRPKQVERKHVHDNDRIWKGGHIKPTSTKFPRNKMIFQTMTEPTYLLFLWCKPNDSLDGMQDS